MDWLRHSRAQDAQWTFGVAAMPLSSVQRADNPIGHPSNPGLLCPAMRRVCLLAIAMISVAVCSAPDASALSFKACKGQKGFGCASLAVPLDRTGTVPGSVRLRVAAEDTAKARRKPGVLVALTGGPGQSGADFASSFAETLKPLLGSYRLVTLDQRGTGASGALDCPVIQRLSSLDAFQAASVGACASRIGARRRAYTTIDTVEDLEALRVALKAPKLALAGISYGTYVAQQYARVHPATTDRLLLDSVVAPDGVDPFLLDSFERLPRVLEEQCDDGLCRGATADPVGDLGALVKRLAGDGTLSGRTYDAAGKARTTSFSTGEELFFALIAGDLNPYLQAAFPGAINAAVRGDTAPLARLRRVAAGVASSRRELSGGLNVVTGCEDARLPYALTDPFADRDLEAATALGAVDPKRFAPWDADTVRTAGYVDDCLRFPAPDGAAPLPVPSTLPLPQVPTLLLSGRLDIRTPLENAQAVAAGGPDQVQRVTVPGTGHDELDSDQTGCVAAALATWARGGQVEDPCAGKSNAIVPFPRPPLTVSAFSAAPGVPAPAGRVVAAALDTVSDARVSVLQALFGGLAPRGGGLRGGRFALGSDDGLRLTNYSYVRGVALTGRLRISAGSLVGRVSVRAGSQSGSLTLSARGASGTLGGQPVAVRLADASAASSSGAAPTLWQRTQRLGAFTTPGRRAG